MKKQAERKPHDFVVLDWWLYAPLRPLKDTGNYRNCGQMKKPAEKTACKYDFRGMKPWLNEYASHEEAKRVYAAWWNHRNDPAIVPKGMRLKYHKLRFLIRL